MRASVYPVERQEVFLNLLSSCKWWSWNGLITSYDLSRVKYGFQRQYSLPPFVFDFSACLIQSFTYAD